MILNISVLMDMEMFKKETKEIIEEIETLFENCR